MGGAGGGCREGCRGGAGGVWGFPKLLAEAKSDENERTKSECSGSNTPWAYRPGEFIPNLFPGVKSSSWLSHHSLGFQMKPWAFK